MGKIVQINIFLGNEISHILHFRWILYLRVNPWEEILTLSSKYNVLRSNRCLPKSNSCIFTVIQDLYISFLPIKTVSFGLRFYTTN